jgi:Flp pilus assembly protein protease CpaA
MIELIYIICILLLVIGSITDLRIREVPDWLNFSGIFAGLGIRLIWSVSSFNWSYILEGLTGFGVFLAVGVAMFYMGQWGGGDSKLLMALGALLGLKFNLSYITVGFLANLVFFGGMYGLAWSIGLAFANWKKFKKQFIKQLSERKRWRAVIIGFSFGSFVFAFFMSSSFLRLFLILMAVLVPFMNYMIIAIKSVEAVCMYKLTKPKDLTEGDWIAKDIYVKSKRICGPKDLGIEKKQINQLIKAKVKSVLVRSGIPFVPSFLIAFLVTLWIGNPLIYLL